jgi:hypothetical protein
VHRRPELLVARVRLADRRPPGFEIEHGRHAVARVEPAARQRLGVSVQVDEAGGHDHSAHLDDRVPVQRLTRDRRDLPAGDADIADPVEPTLRVEHPATAQHQVVDGHWCTLAIMRASERQRASGQLRPAWPGNAVTVMRAQRKRTRAARSLWFDIDR